MWASIRWRFRCAPPPCARSVKPRCGPREKSSRTERLDGLVPGHRRTLGTAEQLVAEVPTMEEAQQLLVVGTAVGEHELLQRGVALLPRGGPLREELPEIVEVGLCARVADL